MENLLILFPYTVSLIAVKLKKCVKNLFLKSLLCENVVSINISLKKLLMLPMIPDQFVTNKLLKVLGNTAFF